MKHDFKLSSSYHHRETSPKIEDETRYWGVGKRYILEDVQETALTLPLPLTTVQCMTAYGGHIIRHKGKATLTCKANRREEVLELYVVQKCKKKDKMMMMMMMMRMMMMIMMMIMKSKIYVATNIEFWSL